uniref:Uncharacterized protein n=1 Tax=Cacopsylla melanoneura TaxID=428564 RepID=A0A8D8QG44_9HEMI
MAVPLVAPTFHVIIAVEISNEKISTFFYQPPAEGAEIPRGPSRFQVENPTKFHQNQSPKSYPFFVDQKKKKKKKKKKKTNRIKLNQLKKNSAFVLKTKTKIPDFLLCAIILFAVYSMVYVLDLLSNDLLCLLICLNVSFNCNSDIETGILPSRAQSYESTAYYLQIYILSFRAIYNLFDRFKK